MSKFLATDYHYFDFHSQKSSVTSNQGEYIHEDVQFATVHALDMWHKSEVKFL